MKECYQGRKGLKDSSRHNVFLTEEVDSPGVVYKPLLPVIEEEVQPRTFLQTSSLLRDTLQDCEQELIELKSKIMRKDGKTSKKVGRALISRLEKTDVSKVLDIEEDSNTSWALP